PMRRSTASPAGSRSPRARSGAAARCCSATSRTSASCAGGGCRKGPSWRRMPPAWPTGPPSTATHWAWGRETAGARAAGAGVGGRVGRVGDDGARSVLAERFQGKRLNSPNDIVVKSDGSIYFTDPPYAVRPLPPGTARPAGWWTQPIEGKELAFQGVYRIAPDGSLHLLVDDFA